MRDILSFPSEGAYRSSLYGFDPTSEAPPRRPTFPSFPSDIRTRSQSADTRSSRLEDAIDRVSTNFQDFPSTVRRQPSPTHLQPQQQEPFSHRPLQQILRERSPTSTSAILNLLQRYPSARNSILKNSTNDLDPPLADTLRRSYLNSSSNPSSELSLSSSLHDDHRPSPSFDRFEHHSLRAPLATSHQSIAPLNNGRASYQPEANTSSLNYSHIPYTNGHSNGTFSNGTYPESNPYRNGYTNGHSNSDDYYDPSLDISQLDEIFEDMNRSTVEWRNSFNKAKQAFRDRSVEDVPEHSSMFQGFTTNGGSSVSVSATLPRSLSKSQSSSQVNDRSMLSQAVNRRASEAPDYHRSEQIGSFWQNTLSSRSPSPTPQRISTTLTDRLLPAEDANSSMYSNSSRKSDSFVSRQAPFMQQPNFSALDRAVEELSTRGGCARFPLDDHAFSPPRRPFGRMNGFHSPSPDSSEASSYGIPNGLPHPKPRHNVREQLATVSGISSIRPNFPSTGTVSNRISEFEKRPGTPTLMVAGSNREPPPLSPRSTVFRTKPVIHVDIGGTKSTTHFDFSRKNSQVRRKHPC